MLCAETESGDILLDEGTVTIHLSCQAEKLLAVSDLSVFANDSAAGLVFHLAPWLGFGAQGFRNMSCRGALGCCVVH